MTKWKVGDHPEAQAISAAEAAAIICGDVLGNGKEMASDGDLKAKPEIKEETPEKVVKKTPPKETKKAQEVIEIVEEKKELEDSKLPKKVTDSRVFDQSLMTQARKEHGTVRLLKVAVPEPHSFINMSQRAP